MLIIALQRQRPTCSFATPQDNGATNYYFVYPLYNFIIKKN